MAASLDKSLINEVIRAGSLACAGLVGVGALLLVGQTLAQAAVIPGPLGLGAVSLGLLPAVLGVALPAGLLVGSVAVGRRWAEAGDALALATAGLGARRLAAPLLLLGVAVGGLQGLLAHGLEPLGRAGARRALAGAADEVALQAGQPLSAGDLLLHAGAVEGAELSEVFVAAGAVVVSAKAGRVREGGLLELDLGEAVAVGRPGEEPGGWRLGFARASLPLELGRRRVELIERSTPDLQDLIARTRAAGRDAAAERLALYKRTSLPLGAPLLGLLGLPLGARGARPGAVTAATALLWWAAVRVCDQTVGALGPLVASALPLGLLGLATLLTWATWRDR